MRWLPPTVPTGRAARGRGVGAVASAPSCACMRPRQWIKNLLVFASPAAAGVLDDPDYAARALVVFVAFCLAASGPTASTT